MKQSKPQRKDLTRGERLTFTVVGALAVIHGYGQILSGKPIYTNWRGLAWIIHDFASEKRKGALKD